MTETNDILIRLFHKETGEMIEVYTVDAKEILRAKDCCYQKHAPGTAAAEAAVDEGAIINYPDDMPSEEEFSDMGLKEIKQLARARFNAELSLREKKKAIAAVKEMFAAEASANE